MKYNLKLGLDAQEATAVPATILKVSDILPNTHMPTVNSYRVALRSILILTTHVPNLKSRPKYLAKSRADYVDEKIT